MSYQPFANLPAALAAFAAGRCRRHVEIDGHVIDLVQAEAEARRVREEPAAIAPPEPPPGVPGREGLAPRPTARLSVKPWSAVSAST